jgi:hypothetical protein
MVANTHQYPSNNSNDKNTRTNRLTSLPENTQYGINNPISPYSPPLHNVHTMSPVDNKGSQKVISKDSIIRKYDDFFGEKVNTEVLKEENSRLYYEKLAL